MAIRNRSAFVTLYLLRRKYCVHNHMYVQGVLLRSPLFFLSAVERLSDENLASRTNNLKGLKKLQPVILSSFSLASFCLVLEVDLNLTAPSVLP